MDCPTLTSDPTLFNKEIEPDIHVMIPTEPIAATASLPNRPTHAMSVRLYAIQYLRIVSTGLPFVFLSAAFTGIYNAAGRSKVPFFISGTGLILNIVLDPLFIFGFGLGTNGAAEEHVDEGKQCI